MAFHHKIQNSVSVPVPFNSFVRDMLSTTHFTAYSVRCCKRVQCFKRLIETLLPLFYSQPVCPLRSMQRQPQLFVFERTNMVQVPVIGDGNCARLSVSLTFRVLLAVGLVRVPSSIRLSAENTILVSFVGSCRCQGTRGSFATSALCSCANRGGDPCRKFARVQPARSRADTSWGPQTRRSGSRHHLQVERSGLFNLPAHH